MTLEQQRAKHAWQKAQEGIDHHGSEYANAAKALPALIMNSGLMQVMAFCHDKGKQYEMVATHLRHWLNQQCNTPSGFSPFMEHLMEADAKTFQRINTEAFAWLKWLRHMASATKGRH